MPKNVAAAFDFIEELFVVCFDSAIVLNLFCVDFEKTLTD